MIKKIVSVLIVLLGLFFYAQEFYGLTIGPSRFEVSLPPGEVAGADYYVQNETEEPIHVLVEPENWFKEAYIYGDLKIEDWIEFDTYEFDLKPREIKKLRLTIRVPEDASGELVAQIFFTSSAQGGEQKLGGVNVRLGGVLYVAIKGTEVVDAEIQDIKIEKPKASDASEWPIKVKVKNKGNIHLRPKGKVLIENKKKETVAELNLAYGRAVLPNRTFDYYAFWEDPKPGTYIAKATIDYGMVFDLDKAIDLGKSASFEKSFKISENGEVIYQ